jgi:hypothetical protein
VLVLLLLAEHRHAADAGQLLHCICWLQHSLSQAWPGSHIRLCAKHIHLLNMQQPQAKAAGRQLNFLFLHLTRTKDCKLTKWISQLLKVKDS